MSIFAEPAKDLARAACARWEGTPHADNMAALGVGVSCIHFVAEVLFAARVLPRRVLPRYDPRAGMFGHVSMLQELSGHCLFCRDATGEPPDFGDILIWRTGGSSGHVGIVVDGRVWHSLAGRRVKSHAYDVCLFHVEQSVRLTNFGWKNWPDNLVVKTA